MVTLPGGRWDFEKELAKSLKGKLRFHSYERDKQVFQECVKNKPRGLPATLKNQDVFEDLEDLWYQLPDGYEAAWVDLNGPPQRLWHLEKLQDLRKEVPLIALTFMNSRFLGEVREDRLRFNGDSREWISSYLGEPDHWVSYYDTVGMVHGVWINK